MYTTEGFAPKDAKIIRENPDKSPYELMTDFGLSEKAYNRLLEQESVERAAPKVQAESQPNPKSSGAIQPEKVEKVKGKSANQPALSSLPTQQPGVFQTVKIVGGSGVPQTMNRKMAEDMVRRYPNEFKIIS